MPSIISGFLVAFLLPESPKFLMSRGRNDAAMKVFRKIHRMNNGALIEYPVSKFKSQLVELNLIKFVCEQKNNFRLKIWSWKKWRM